MCVCAPRSAFDFGSAKCVCRAAHVCSQINCLPDLGEASATFIRTYIYTLHAPHKLISILHSQGNYSAALGLQKEKQESERMPVGGLVRAARRSILYLPSSLALSCALASAPTVKFTLAAKSRLASF